MPKFACELRRLRQSRRMTQHALAEALQVTSGTISAWERGVRLPEHGTMERVASFFNVPVSLFFVEDEHEGNGGEQVDQAISAIKMLAQMKPPELTMACAVIEAVYKNGSVKAS